MNDDGFDEVNGIEGSASAFAAVTPSSTYFNSIADIGSVNRWSTVTSMSLTSGAASSKSAVFNSTVVNPAAVASAIEPRFARRQVARVSRQRTQKFQGRIRGSEGSMQRATQSPRRKSQGVCVPECSTIRSKHWFS